MLVKNKGMTVKTGLDGVDKILLGGLRPGTVTEVSLLGLLHDFSLYMTTYQIWEGKPTSSGTHPLPPENQKSTHFWALSSTRRLCSKENFNIQ